MVVMAYYAWRHWKECDHCWHCLRFSRTQNLSRLQSPCLPLPCLHSVVSVLCSFIKSLSHPDLFHPFPGNSAIALHSPQPLIRYRLLMHALSSSMKTVSEAFHSVFSSFHELMQSCGIRHSTVRLSVCKLCGNRFFYRKHDWIIKLVHNGPHMGLHPGCAQGQGQRSRDTDCWATEFMRNGLRNFTKFSAENCGPWISVPCTSNMLLQCTNVHHVTFLYISGSLTGFYSLWYFLFHSNAGEVWRFCQHFHRVTWCQMIALDLRRRKSAAKYCGWSQSAVNLLFGGRQIFLAKFGGGSVQHCNFCKAIVTKPDTLHYVMDTFHQEKFGHWAQSVKGFLLPM